MYIFSHMLVEQRQLPDQQVDSGSWVAQLCKNNSGLNPLPGDTLPPATSGPVWNLIIFKYFFAKLSFLFNNCEQIQLLK